MKALAVIGINKFAKEVDHLIKRSKTPKHSASTTVYTADLHTFTCRDAEVRAKLLTSLNETMHKHFEVIYDGEERYLTTLQLVIDLIDIRDVAGGSNMHVLRHGAGVAGNHEISNVQGEISSGKLSSDTMGEARRETERVRRMRRRERQRANRR